MTNATNKIGILFAEIDSAGSLKLAGDRVLFGARKSAAPSNTEWLTRQRVAQCRADIARVVHRQGGIIARTNGDQICCHLPSAQAALEAAIEIQRTRSARVGEQSENSPVEAPLGVRVTLGYGPIVVDAGRLSGPALETTRALLKKTDAEVILATGALVEALPAHDRGLAEAIGPVALEGLAEAPEVWAVAWRADEGPVEPSIYDRADAVPAQDTPAAAPKAVAPSADAPPARPTAATPAAAPVEAPVEELAEALAKARAEPRTPAMAARPPAAAAPPQPPPRPEPESPPSVADGPELKLRFKDKEFALNRAHPMLMLRSGKDRDEHAKILLLDDRFVIENFNVAGTRLKRADGSEEVCLERAELTEHGAISLGQDFSQSSQVIEFSVVH